MSVKEPNHLKLTESLNYNSVWNLDEKIYRRYKMEGEKPHSLSRLPKNDISNGISVNRGYYSYPEDVLFSVIENENDCSFHKKPDDFNYCYFTINELIQNAEIHDSDTGEHVCSIKLKQSPNLFNVSHCDIVFEPKIETNNSVHINLIRKYLESLPGFGFNQNAL